MTYNLSTSSFLTEAKKLINTPDKWTKGVFARTSPNGNVIGPQTVGAKCFCSIGAINNMALNDQLTSYYAETELRDAVHSYRDKAWFGIVQFNDDPDTTHEMMMEVWDMAIESAKQKELEQLKPPTFTQY